MYSNVSETKCVYVVFTNNRHNAQSVVTQHHAGVDSWQCLSASIFLALKVNSEFGSHLTECFTHSHFYIQNLQNKHRFLDLHYAQCISFSSRCFTGQQRNLTCTQNWLTICHLLFFLSSFALYHLSPKWNTYKPQLQKNNASNFVLHLQSSVTTNTTNIVLLLSVTAAAPSPPPPSILLLALFNSILFWRYFSLDQISDEKSLQQIFYVLDALPVAEATGKKHLQTTLWWSAKKWNRTLSFIIIISHATTAGFIIIIITHSAASLIITFTWCSHRAAVSFL